MYFELLIIILVGFFFIDTFVSYLNSKNSKLKLPDEAKDIYDREKYQKQQSYDREKYKFGFISSLFSLMVMLIILVFGGFGWLDGALRNIFENEILISLGFFAILALGQTLLNIPFGYYFTFVIEQKFGFNKMTKKLFFLDILKGLILSFVIGGILLFIIIFLYQFSPKYFALFTWIFISIFSLLMMMFYSSIIVPIFNKQTPLKDGPLKTAILDFAKKAGFELDNIFVIDGSKRSSKANAYFSGFGPKKRIVLFDTLIDDLTQDELVAVLAHEIGHYKKKHTLQMLMFSLIQTGIIIFLFSLLIENSSFARALGGEFASFHLGMIAFGILFTPVSFFLGIFGNILSRKNEYEADDYAKKQYNGDDLISALKKLSQNNLSNLTPHPLYEFIHYSHPNVLKRISALQK